MKENDFCIIANNCWGAEAYKKYELPFNTPTIGLYFYPDDYLNFIADLDRNLRTGLRFVRESRNIQNQKHPVGVVNGIEIQFLHYDSEQEAFEKWTRRCKRVFRDEKRLLFKFDDRDGATKEHIHRFHGMGLAHSICFTKEPYPEYPSNLQIPMGVNENSVMDGYDQFYVAEGFFDLGQLLLRKGIIRSPAQRIRLAARKAGLGMRDLLPRSR